MRRRRKEGKGKIAGGEEGERKWQVERRGEEEGENCAPSSQK